MLYEITIRIFVARGARFRSRKFENHLGIARDNATIEKKAICHDCRLAFDLSAIPDMSADVYQYGV